MSSKRFFFRTFDDFNVNAGAYENLVDEIIAIRASRTALVAMAWTFLMA